MERHIQRRARWLVYCNLVACFGCGAARTHGDQGNGSERPGTIQPIGIERVGSPIALGRAGDRIFAYVANAEDESLHILDVDGRREIAANDLAGGPSELLLTRDGRLIVSFRSASLIQLFRLEGPDVPPEPAEQAAVPIDPVGLALSVDEKTLFVTSALGQRLSAYDAQDLTRLWERSLERDPWDMALSEDGKKMFVSHAVGGRVSVVSLTDPHDGPRVISILSRPDTDTRKTSATLPGQEPPPRARLGLQNFSLAKSVSPSGRIFVPGVLVDPGDREVASSGYGDTPLTELSNIAVLDADRAQLLLASVNPGVPITSNIGWGVRARPQCLLPRAATVDPKTGVLLVACSGMDRVMAFDAASADPRSARLASWPVAQDPVGIAIDADRRRALIWSQQRRSVDFIALDDPAPSEASIERVELSRKARHEKGDLALGRALFHRVSDPRISADGRACASCHVDGRDDGLTWATPVGPRQTPALAGRVRGTKPFGWDGDGADLVEHLRHTFGRLHGTGLSDRELAALIAYVESLPAPASSGADAADEPARGKSVFFSTKTGCAVCHSGPAFTDGQLHDVGSRAAADRESRFNTPSLLGLRGSAPYLHDGRFASLEQMLLSMDGKMGRTKHLSKSDFAALVAYLESL